MCGFVGFTDVKNDSNKIIKSMADKIIHRGPDSYGYHTDGDIALGFRRLSIIDITESGDQPIYNEDKTKVLMFNGEIYNYKEIRSDLQSKGHDFKTNTDSETVLHGYEEYGAAILNKLRGMFAFVIWDIHEKQLFGARDFFGIKPFYYAKMGKAFIFGSEIKSFLAHPDFKKELNEAALENYLTFQYSPTEETFFKNVYKLPASHYFIYQDGQMSVKRYRSISFEPDNKPSINEWTDRISDTFKNSVKAHKVADVEVGSFLSSGVDSSYVAAEADVDKTFTVGFGEDERYNEIGYAKEFSGYIKKENISKVITKEEYWAALPKVQYHMDEPLADPSCIALYFVCNKAAEYVKVVLSGEGADEIFGGYNVYREPLSGGAYNSLPRFVKRTVGTAAAVLPQRRGVNFLVRKGRDIEERFIGNAFIFTEKERKALLKNKTSAPPPTEITKPFYAQVKGSDDVTKMQYLDLHLWMTGDILLKADKMSMANSLELRVPFLDKEVMALAEKIPVKHRIAAGTTKYALRQAALRACPPETAGKKKLGFPVPIRVWLKEEDSYRIVKNCFTSKTAEQFFNTAELVKLIDLHKAGKTDNSRKIWTVFMFLVWYDVYFG
ncbi:MAG: asparagine synthase (glutamine-hydrolyzing) [Oscillospiraceae bacterium]|nr:asparagine synthase (glutamine-hydrolyzing) [Oscillospiraceae bacterium]